MTERHRTAATKRALERYSNGESGVDAANAEEIHVTTLYRDPEYKRLRDERKKEREDGNA